MQDLETPPATPMRTQPPPLVRNLTPTTPPPDDEPEPFDCMPFDIRHDYDAWLLELKGDDELLAQSSRGFSQRAQTITAFLKACMRWAEADEHTDGVFKTEFSRIKFRHDIELNDHPMHYKFIHDDNYKRLVSECKAKEAINFVDSAFFWGLRKQLTLATVDGQLDGPWCPNPRHMVPGTLSKAFTFIESWISNHKATMRMHRQETVAETMDIARVTSGLNFISQDEYLLLAVDKQKVVSDSISNFFDGETKASVLVQSTVDVTTILTHEQARECFADMWFLRGPGGSLSSPFDFKFFVPSVDTYQKLARECATKDMRLSENADTIDDLKLKLAGCRETHIDDKQKLKRAEKQVTELKAAVSELKELRQKLAETTGFNAGLHKMYSELQNKYFQQSEKHGAQRLMLGQEVLKNDTERANKRQRTDGTDV